MNKNAHTPGPWRIEMMTDGTTVEIRDANGIYIAEAGDTSLEDEANARLIAAAPELLEALEAVLRETCDPEPEHYGRSREDQMKAQRQAFTGARAAIAKARGLQ